MKIREFSNFIHILFVTSLGFSTYSLNGQVIFIEDTVIKPHTKFNISYDGFPGNPTDWISFAKKGQSSETYIQYFYLNSQKKGSLEFDGVTSGDYELRGYFNNEQVIRVIFPFKVGSGDTPGGNPLVSLIPGTINVQGVLSTSGGQIVPDGAYSITFRFYDSPMSGSALWDEKHDNLQVLSGVFSAILGLSKPFNLAFDKPYFLGIQLANETEMKPRIELTAVPYSLMAKTVEDNSISTGKLQSNAVTADKIAPSLLSGINGVTNDGGNINIMAGANISIVNDDQTNSITISSVNPGGGGGGISRINPGTAISVSGQDGPTTTISVSPNSITGTEIQNNTIAADKIIPNVISSLSGVSNDGGNINLVAGSNISIVPNDANKTITISAAGGGTGTGSISQLIEGNGIGIQNPFGPNTTIGLKPNILLGPNGSLYVLNQNNTAVAGISANTNNQGGYLTTSNAQGIQMFGVTIFGDGQPGLTLNSRLGRQVIDVKANEFSDGEINLKSVLTNTTVRLGSNDNAGGLVHVFNRAGILASQIGVNPRGDGLVKLNSVNNRTTLELESIAEGAGILRLFNEEGTSVLRLTTSESLGGRLVINNRSGNEAVSASSNNSGDGGLFIRSGRDRLLIGMQNNADNGGGKFGVFNEEGNETIRLSNFIDGQPFMILKNRLGNVAAELSVNEFSDGELTLRSVLNNPTVKLGSTDNAGGIINVFNRGGQPMAVILDNGNGGFIDILNNDGTEVITMGITEDLNARIQVNNRLGNSSAELFSNEFSDGQLTLNSVLNNPTVIAGANDNAGGLIKVFNQNGKLAARLTERTGGFLGVFNTDETEMIQMGTLEDLNGLIRVNNRLGNPVADIQSNEFSDGQLTLGSVLKNRTILLTANDNAGGLINVFNKSGSVSAQITETEGDGLFKIFNKDSQLVHQLGINENRAGLFEIKSIYKNPENVAEMGGNEDDEGHLYLFNRDSKAAVYLSAAGGDGDFSLSDIDGKIKTSLSGSRFGGTLSIRNENNQPVHFMGSNGKTKEGFYSIFNKSDINKNRLSMGGDSLGNGYLNVFNYNGLNTFFMGHNQFADGMISIKNNMGNLGALFEALKDGGSVTVTDGKPGTNHRGVLLNGLNGGKLSLFNNQTRLVNVLGVGENGEGLLQIVNKQDLTKNRLELGGDDAAAGYLKLFNSNAMKTAELGAFPGGSGFLSTYGPTGKRQTHLAQFGNGGAIYVMNENETAVGTLAFDGNGGLVWVTNKDRTGGAFMSHNTRGGDIHVRNNSEKIGAEMITAANLGGEFNIYDANGGNTSRLSNAATGGGLIEVGTANGDKVGRLTTLDGTGYIGLDNIDKMEVVRITANQGKGGGMALRNDKGFDMIKLTQDQSHGAILVNNAAGGLMSILTRTTLGGGFFGTKDHHGSDAVWLTTNDKGGGNLTTFNDLGKVSATINMNAAGQGKIAVNGPGGNELATMTGTAQGTGFVNIFNGTGKSLAGIANNTVSGGGYLFVNNSAGAFLGGITTNNSSGGGYLHANTSSGKDVARMTSSNGGGVVVIDNPTGVPVSYLSFNNNNGGYVGIANAAGNDRARLTINTGGSGIVSVSNTSGRDVVEATVSTDNHGTLATYNSAGAVIAGLLATSSGHGYIRASNSAGNERASMSSGSLGGTVDVYDISGKQRVLMSGGGNMTVTDADGSYLSNYSTGSGVNLILVDRFQHPRAEIKSGTILAKGPNGIEHSFMSSATATNLGYIGVCNSNIVGSPVKAGMYTNESNQGVLFADVKNFKMDYPGKPDKQIWYGSLEGPELAAYIRGTGKLVNGKAFIEFTDHYQKVANTATMTVILTPLSGKSKGLAVVSKKSTGFEVEELSEGSGTYEFDWEAKCVRNGHEGFEVVRNKSDDPKPLIQRSEFPLKLESRNSDKLETDPVLKGNPIIKEIVKAQND